MGLIFRRSVKILPGVRLNFSKSGVSTSFGTRGARVTVGKNRVTTSVGIPGTGISYRTTTSRKKPKTKIPKYSVGSAYAYSGNGYGSSTNAYTPPTEVKSTSFTIFVGVLFLIVLALFIWSFTWSWESHYREYCGQRIYRYTDWSWLKWIFYPPVCFFGLILGGIFLSELKKTKEDSDKDNVISPSTDSIAEEKAKVDDTPLEMKAFELIKKISNPVIDTKLLSCRDEGRYWGIYFKNENKKPICRFYLRGNSNFIGLFDKFGSESMKPLERILDVYLYADDLRSLMKHYNQA